MKTNHKARYQAGYKANKDVHAWECIDKLGKLEDLKEQGKLMKLPCACGDYAVFSDGSIIPVTYVTFEQEDVIVGCQNGIRISMALQFGNWCKGFYKNYEEAETALRTLKK